MKKNKGMTLVETIVALSILLVAIGIFYGSVQLSNKIISNQNKQRELSEEMINAYYKVSNGSTNEIGFTLTVIDENGKEANTFFSNIKLKKIANDNKEIYYYE